MDREHIEEASESRQPARVMSKSTRLKRKVVKAVIVMMFVSLCMIVFLLVFQIRRLDVEGNKYVSRQEVADFIITDDATTNSLYTYFKFHFTNYKRPDAIESVDVKFEKPWALKVIVHEKQIVGYIVWNDEFCYFDKDGVVLEKTREWWDGVPGIEGLDPQNVTLYEPLPVSDANKKAFENLLEMSETLAKYNLTPDKISCREADLILYFGTVCVNLGHDNLKNRIAQIPPIMEKLGGQGGTLHLETFTNDSSTIRFEQGAML